MRYILASKSPRRKELLGRLGIEFDVISARGKEQMAGSSPSETVTGLARQKAEEVFSRIENGEASLKLQDADVTVIGADTLVAKDGLILGKPSDADDAARMLRLLSGCVHQVYTGVCIIVKRAGDIQEKTFFEKTDVHVCTLSEKEISDYIATREPFDKAGSYGIQGSFAVHVSGIEGDYNNVVGLPVSRLYHELKQL